MRAKNHYEMREYTIDMLEDGKDLSFCAKQRPYPIYPSKGGLNPDFLRNFIARFVHQNSGYINLQDTNFCHFNLYICYIALQFEF